MFIDDDLDPKHKIKKPKDLSKHSVDELDDYVAALEAEVQRAQAEKAKKLAHRDAASTLFKK